MAQRGQLKLLGSESKDILKVLNDEQLNEQLENSASILGKCFTSPIVSTTSNGDSKASNNRTASVNPNRWENDFLHLPFIRPHLLEFLAGTHDFKSLAVCSKSLLAETQGEESIREWLLQQQWIKHLNRM